MTSTEIREVEEKIGYKFREAYLLTQAFTRRSYTEENREYEDNEKLEFVGDKVLDFVVVKRLTHLYGSVTKPLLMIPSAPKRIFEFTLTESEMTEKKKQVVQTAFLSKAAERLGLQNYLLMGKGDIQNNVQDNPHVKEDLIEAIIGAIAIDSDWNMSDIERAIDRMLDINHYLINGVDDGTDYISYVKTWHDKEYGEAPEYSFDNAPDEKIFKCFLKFPGYDGASFDGVGYSKKEAERMAAKRAYEYLEERKKSRDAIFDAIGEFDFESAVSKLQILRDKKIISNVVYTFKEIQAPEEGDGNPIWSCECSVPGIEESPEYRDKTKALAKKAAAYEMLVILTGRNTIIDMFLQYGKKVNISDENN